METLQWEDTDWTSGSSSTRTMPRGASSQDIPHRSFMCTSFTWSKTTYVEGGRNADEQISRPPSSNTTSFHQHQRCRCSQLRKLWKLLQIHILIKIRTFNKSNVSEPNAGEMKINKKVYFIWNNSMLFFHFCLWVLCWSMCVHTLKRESLLWSLLATYEHTALLQKFWTASMFDFKLVFELGNKLSNADILMLRSCCHFLLLKFIAHIYVG